MDPVRPSTPDCAFDACRQQGANSYWEGLKVTDNPFPPVPYNEHEPWWDNSNTAWYMGWLDEKVSVDSGGRLFFFQEM